MIRFLCIIAFVFASSTSISQSREFMRKAKAALEATDETDTIIPNQVTEDEYDFRSEGLGNLEALLISELERISRDKIDHLKTSKTLNTLAAVATSAWKGSQYGNHQKWKKLNKYFRRASNQCTSSFNMIRAISFRIPLINNKGKKFYYDRKGPDGELNLFFGNAPKTKEEREEMEQIPLGYHTEKYLIEKCMHYMRKRSIYKDVKRGLYSYVGLKIEVDTRTIYKNKIPTARVVIVVGARRLAKVKVK